MRTNLTTMLQKAAATSHAVNVLLKGGSDPAWGQAPAPDPGTMRRQAAELRERAAEMRKSGGSSDRGMAQQLEEQANNLVCAAAQADTSLTKALLPRRAVEPIRVPRPAIVTSGPLEKAAAAGAQYTPESFAARLARRRVDEKLPAMLDALRDTLADILASAGSDKRTLLRQAFAEFEAALPGDMVAAIAKGRPAGGPVRPLLTKTA